jgi:hypothetical protein
MTPRASSAKCLWHNPAGLSSAAQPGIGLERIDDGDEIVEPDDPLELEAGAGITGPDHIRLDPAYDRQTDNNPVSAREPVRIIDHEAVCGQVADMQAEIATLVVLEHDRKIDRMTRGTAHVCNAEVCSDRHFEAASLFGLFLSKMPGKG